LSMQSASTSSSLRSVVEGHPLVDLTDRIERHSAIRTSNGAFSDVYKAYITGSSSQVAVKVLRYYESPDPGENRRVLDRLNNKLRRELGILRSLEHPNIVPLLGVATIFGPTLGVVLPWMSHGTLYSFMKSRTLALMDRLHLVHGIGSGLEYLHSNNVFHGDLHSSNILIDEDQLPRINGFGLARTIEKVQPGLTYLQRLANTNHSGSARWAAPERLSGSKPHPSADIYSFGSIMFEVLSGEVPWKEKTDCKIIALKLTSHELPCRPERGTIRNQHWRLMVRCWSARPHQRPKATEVVIALHTFLLKKQAVGWRDRETSNIISFFVFLLFIVIIFFSFRFLIYQSVGLHAVADRQSRQS